MQVPLAFDQLSYFDNKSFYTFVVTAGYEVEDLELILSYGADVDVQNNAGETALYLALCKTDKCVLFPINPDRHFFLSALSTYYTSNYERCDNILLLLNHNADTTLTPEGQPSLCFYNFKWEFVIPDCEEFGCSSNPDNCAGCAYCYQPGHDFCTSTKY